MSVIRLATVARHLLAWVGYAAGVTADEGPESPARLTYSRDTTSEPGR